MSTESVFSRVPSELDFPKEEREILAFWKEQKVFEKSIASPEGKPTFVFFEGPPTANGMPHNGHVLTRAIKDLIPRYKTMRGFHVPRKAGWDTHGLPVEVEIEKELRIHGKGAIVEYGVEPFVRKCIDSVFRYQSEWEKLTDRIAFWVDLDAAYVTYHKSYIESVWWALSELFRRGLLYQGHKVVWWWAQGGTALSSAEVGQGYKQVDDPSCYVAFPLTAASGLLQGASLLAWTTTPWTLPSNMYAAVGATYTYVVANVGEKKLIVAESLLAGLAAKMKVEPEILGTVTGRELVGHQYAPPFDLFKDTPHPAVHRIIATDFVTLDSGTGIVHIAPAFGEDDHSAHRRLLADYPDLPLYCAVNPDGTFIEGFAPYAGRWVKDCDKEIQSALKAAGLLVFAEIYRHDYPFCWRSDQDPLIQYARPAWYIRTTQFKDAAIANNQAINWYPPHIKDGRFGDFLANNVDWALSRERFWGTPLNLWINDASGAIEAPASVAEILKKNPQAFDHFAKAKAADPTLSEHLMVHKPWVDHVTWENPGEAGTYRRVPEVIDCWFDSGCMPFAQWGFPHQGHEQFKQSFPADFISEAIDQTRGWFYTLLMVSTLLFDEETTKRFNLPAAVAPHPFKNCIVLGHVADREGKKESKSKGNYTPPDVILDAVRMEFATVAATAALKPNEGTAFIAREDLEGLDLQEGALVRVYGADKKDAARMLTLKAGKGMKRRVVILADADRSALGLQFAEGDGGKTVDVPNLPASVRAVIEDPHASAPGADAFRWFFYASNPPWNSTRHSLSNVRALQKETLVKLRNVYSFFTIYANIDAFVPAAKGSDFAARPEIDRWILGELSDTTTKVTNALDSYDIYGATIVLTTLVESLSNWYVRRSRERFWGAGKGDAMSADKRMAYETLYECLEVVARLMAPFTPYVAEAMYQNLVVAPAALHGGHTASGEAVAESVHLAHWPTADVARVNTTLATTMSAVRAFVSLGLQVRTQAKMKVRQPLAHAHLIASDSSIEGNLEKYLSLVREELNVDSIDLVPTSRASQYVRYRPKPNFRTLGQKGLGKEAQLLKKQMAELGDEAAAEFVTALTRDKRASMAGVELELTDVELAFETREGFVALGDRVGVVVLQTELTPELVANGLAREVLSVVQGMRKEQKLEFTDRIDVALHGDAEVIAAVRLFESTIQPMWLGASPILFFDGGIDGAGFMQTNINGKQVFLRVTKAA